MGTAFELKLLYPFADASETDFERTFNSKALSSRNANESSSSYIDGT